MKESKAFWQQSTRCQIVSIFIGWHFLSGSGALAQPFGIESNSGSVALHSQALYQQALRSFQAKDYSLCIKLCQQGISQNQFDKQLCQLQALAMAEAGDINGATNMFRAAISLDYNFIQAHNNFGVFFQKLDRLEEAAKQFQECLRINANYPDAHFHLGEILKIKGDLDGAIKEFEAAASLNPNYFEAQEALGLAIFERNTAGEAFDVSASLDKLKRAAELNPSNALVHYYLGNIYCVDGRLDQAEKEFRLALTYDANLAGAHFELAQLRYLRGDPDRALLEIQQAMKVSPLYTISQKYPYLDLVKAKELRAKCLEVKCSPEAVKAWQEVASLAKDKSKVLKRVSHVEKLVKDYQHKLKKEKIDYDLVEKLLSQGIMASESGATVEAKKDFKKVLELDPDNFTAWQNLGALAEIVGDFPKALKYYKQAMDIQPNYDGIYYNMAYLLEKMGLPAEAGSMYKSFHKLAGSYPYDPRHVVALQQYANKEISK